MTSLIIKSKIWNKSNSPLINYKDKNFLKQKITIERTGIISRRKDKIVFKQTENLNTSNNSSENTNYMNEPRTSELISIEKRVDESNFYINCGDWPKDLVQLIDQNAVYFLYKGLTIENFLKEKQKYYVLSQGDIIKLGKIYLKILHIKLTGNNKKEEEDEKDKINATTDKEHSDMNKKIVSDSDSNSDEENESDGDNEENDKESGVENEIKKEENEDEDSKKRETIKKNYSPDNLNRNNNKRNKKENESNNMEYCESLSNKNNNLANKKKYKKNQSKNNRYKERLNRSFNGNISDDNLEQKLKENINMNRSMSFTFKKSKIKNLSLSLTSFYKMNNFSVQNNSIKKSKQYKNKDNFKKVKKDDKDKQNVKKKEKSGIKQKEKDMEKDNIKLHEKKEKGKICRICLSGEDSPVKNPLICPCTCKGSMKFIHYSCLKNWLNLKIESDLGYGRDLETEQPTITYSTKDIACELCKTKLPDYIKHKGKIYNVSFYKPKYNKFIVLESIRDDNRRTKFIHIIPLNRRQIIKIGRLNNCDLSLPDFSISRVHCCMYIESGQLFLENNSKFGTKILVQNPKLTMSPQYPLCIEVQKTYLKLRIQKPFSLFSCCNVYTTSMTKMLVYQKQNERGFDLFCSMVFKEDDGELEEESEINNDNNINNNEDIKNNTNNKNDNENNINDLNNNKSNVIEENKKSKITKKRLIKTENESEKNYNLENTTKEIVKCIELKAEEFENRNEILYDKEKLDDYENKEINENKNIKNKLNNGNKNEDKKNAKNESSTKGQKLIDNNENKIKDIILKENKDIINEKNENTKNTENKKKSQNENNKKNNYKQNTNKENSIKLNNNDKNIINSEYKLTKSKTIQENSGKEDIKKLIENEFKINGRRKSIPKNESKNYNKLVDTKFINFEKKIMKKEKKEEKIIPKIKIKEERNEENEKLLKKQYSIRNKDEKKEENIIKNEIKRKHIQNLNDDKFKNEKIKKNKEEKNKIHYKETEEPKILNEKEEEIIIKKEKEKNEIYKGIINEEKKKVIKNENKNGIKQIKNERTKNNNIIFETDIIKSNPKEIKDDKILENDKSIHSELYKYNGKKKSLKKSIDLNTINDLSYKQGQDITNNKNSALDNYQSIFGLIPSKQNETALLLAPKHTKNKDLKHFDLNINNEQMNSTNKSNISWGKYTSQYEENKHK